MKVCPLCGESLLDDARFCPGDGSLLVTATDPYIGKVFLDQFEVREVCGRGSMGTVYKAWQTSMDREVAIKVLRKNLMKDATIVKRFHREARAAARLSHPNIITVFMVGDTDDGIPFLAMEFVKGQSLASACEADGPLAPVRAIHIVRQITSALTDAHSQNVVHRDLKPENILLSNRPQSPDFVKVLDFGIAKILHGDDGESQLTQTGAIFGTPHYLAPEQASGGDVDHRTDLYALGVILFEVVVGRLPFPSDSGMAVLVQHIKDAPPRPRDLNSRIPQPLEDVILRAMEKDPKDRFQSADDFGEALGRVMDKMQFGAQTLLRVSTDAGLTAGVHEDAPANARAAPAGNKTKRAIPSTVELVPPAKPAEERDAPDTEPQDMAPRSAEERAFDEAVTHKRMAVSAQAPQPEPAPAPEPAPEPGPEIDADPQPAPEDDPEPVPEPEPEPEQEPEPDSQIDALATTVVEREDSETALAVAAAVAGEIVAADSLAEGGTRGDAEAGDEAGAGREEEEASEEKPPGGDMLAGGALDEEATEEVDSLPGQSTMRMANFMLGRRRFLLHTMAGLVTVAGGATAGVLYWRSKQHQGEERSAEPPPEEGEKPEEQRPHDEAAPNERPDEPVPPDVPGKPQEEKTTPEPQPRRKTRRGKKQRRRRRAKPPAERSKHEGKAPEPRTPAKVAPVGPDPTVKSSDHGDHGDHGDHKPKPIKKLVPKKKDTDLYELVD